MSSLFPKQSFRRHSIAQRRLMRQLSIRIDKLTNSIELVATGESFPTILTHLSSKEAAVLSTLWLFDWRREIRYSGREVYKLTTVQEPDVIQGLISLEPKPDHIYMHLVEVAKGNRGKMRLYQGVLGNLVAYACKVAFEHSLDGFVAFDAKSALIDHYKASLGAMQIGKIRLVIETKPAALLVSKYFTDFFAS